MPPRRTTTPRQRAAMTAQQRASRREFEERHGDLAERLRNYAGPHAFLGRMQRILNDSGYLTEGQCATVTTIFREIEDAEAREARARARQEELAGNIARTDDLPRVLNGIYTLDDGVNHLTFDIRTMNRSRNEHMRNARVIRVQRQYGEYQAIGFLRTDATVQVWTATRSRLSTVEIGWAQTLVRLLNDEDTSEELRNLLVEDTAVTSGGSIQFGIIGDGSEDDPEWTLSVACRCNACNRLLTDPTSVRLGRGPECNRQAIARETTRASGAWLDDEIDRINTGRFRDEDGPSSRFRDDDEEDDEPMEAVANVIRDTQERQRAARAERLRQAAERRAAVRAARAARDAQLAADDEDDEDDDYVPVSRRGRQTGVLMSELTPTIIR